MRRFAFIISILALFILLLISQNQSFLIIENPDQIQELEENQQIKVSDLVISESYNQNSRTLFLKSGINLTCSCQNLHSLKNKQIEATAFKETFNKKTYLKVLELQLH